MKQGGYIITDMLGAAITAGAPATISGVFAAISADAEKPVVLTGCKIGSTTFKAAYIEPKKSGDDYIFSAYGYNFTVTAADAVTAVLDTEPEAVKVAAVTAANAAEAAGDAPTAAEFHATVTLANANKTAINAIITALINAGFMAAE